MSSVHRLLHTSEEQQAHLQALGVLSKAKLCAVDTRCLPTPVPQSSAVPDVEVRVKVLPLADTAYAWTHW